MVETDAQKQRASGGRFPPQLDVMLEVVAGRLEHSSVVGCRNVVVGRVGFDLHANHGKPGALQVLGALGRSGKDIGQDGIVAPLRRHRLLDLHAASEDDSRALTPLGLTPGAKRVKRANGAHREVHFEMAAVVVHESHDIGDGPSTVVGQRAGVRCSREA